MSLRGSSLNLSNITFADEPLSHRQYDQGENEANGDAVVVDWILPWLHGVVLKAH